MDIRTLYAQVASLGFEDSIESTEGFYHAANRAIYQVNLLRPHIAEYEIFRQNAKNLLTHGFTTFTRDKDITFEAEGARAYYFEAAGSGTLRIEKYDEGGWQLIGETDIDSESFKPYRGFIKAGGEFTDGRVRLRFLQHSSGNFVYFVRNVAIYKWIYGAAPESIQPYAPFAEYDLSTLLPDFLDLATPPMRAEDMEKMGKGFHLRGARMIFPYAAEGTFKIFYRRKPKEIVHTSAPTEDYTEIDLDDELCTLLPLLTAAYVWAEDEPEKAAYYMELWRERSAEVKAEKKIHSPAKMIDRYGW